MFLQHNVLKISKLKNMQVNFDGQPQNGVTSKDIVLHLIKLIGTAGGTGHAIEFSGSYIAAASIGSANDNLQHGHRSWGKGRFNCGRLYYHLIMLSSIAIFLARY